MTMNQPEKDLKGPVWWPLFPRGGVVISGEHDEDWQHSGAPLWMTAPPVCQPSPFPAWDHLAPLCLFAPVFLLILSVSSLDAWVQDTLLYTPGPSAHLSDTGEKTLNNNRSQNNTAWSFQVYLLLFRVYTSEVYLNLTSDFRFGTPAIRVREYQLCRLMDTLGEFLPGVMPQPVTCPSRLPELMCGAQKIHSLWAGNIFLAFFFFYKIDFN